MPTPARPEAADHLERFRRWLQDHNQPFTRQRRVVATALFTSEAHLSVEELRARLEAAGERVGLATIYRTLDTLLQSGLVRGQEFGEGFRRFEPAGERTGHEHLVCERCGRVTEFTSERLERMLQLLADEHGFQTRHHRVALHGLCGRCRRGALEGL